MTTKPNVAITMLHWGPAEITAKALESLTKVGYEQFHIFLVDQTLKLDIPLPANTTLITPSHNLGFSGGQNLAIKTALKDERYHYILTLNNDVIVEPAFLERLVSALEANPKAAAAGPTILYDNPEKEIWFGGGELLWHQGRVRHLNLRRRLADTPLTEPIVASFITGCSILLRVEALKKVGLLNDSMFMYWEDADWAARAQKQGYTLLYVPKAVITHKVSAALGVNSPNYLYYIFRNNLLFIRLHTPWPWKFMAWWYLLILVAKELVKLVVRYREHYGLYLKRIAQAFIHNAMRRYGQL